jgi:hypothetical protein
MRRIVPFAGFILATSSMGLAGPYPPAAGQVGSDAIHKDDPRFVAWATGYTDLVRGPMDIANPSAGLASFGAGTSALGKAEGTSFDVVSLGDGGRITLTFDTPIGNGPGPDFAVFENGFHQSGSQTTAFLELAFVEVSSNGVDFIRFPSVSLTPSQTQVASFGELDASNLHNLAGKHVREYGTPFDLADVASSPLLDLSAGITHVRIIDVVGRIAPVLDGSVEVWSPSRDSLGNIINDPYPTPFSTGGFDLDAIGVINLIPEPTVLTLLALGGLVLGRNRRSSTSKY